MRDWCFTVTRTLSKETERKKQAKDSNKWQSHGRILIFQFTSKLVSMGCCLSQLQKLTSGVNFPSFIGMMSSPLDLFGPHHRGDFCRRAFDETGHQPFDCCGHFPIAYVHRKTNHQDKGPCRMNARPNRISRRSLQGLLKVKAKRTQANQSMHLHEGLVGMILNNRLTAI